MEEHMFELPPVAALPPGFRTLDELESRIVRTSRFSKLAAAAGVALDVHEGRGSNNFPLTALGAFVTVVGAGGILQSKDWERSAALLRNSAQEGVEILPNP